MGQILHKRATTTQRIRAEIQAAEGSLDKLAKRFGVNRKTINKWRSRDTVTDLPMGNGRANSVLSKEEEQIICKARTTTWLPLDDLFDQLKPVIPKLSRSNLHRCLQHYKISRIPKEYSPKQVVKGRGKFRDYEIGFVHIDITEFYLCGQKHYLYVAIDRVTKLAFAHLYSRKRNLESVDFIGKVLAFYPYKLHRVLTDNGQQFTYRGMNKQLRPKLKRHPFTAALLAAGVKHKLTAFYSPQTNGQVEKMNDILKSATIKMFEYQTVSQFKASLASFLNYYNCSKRLSALRRKTPYEVVLQKWQESPKLFKKNPGHYCVGLDM
jgi:transposase-like protein